VIPLRARSAVLLVAVSVLGLFAFAWPLVLAPGDGATVDAAHATDAPWVFVLLLPLLMAVVLAELAAGRIDAKAVALLGVLVAVGAALRLPSTGVAGVELVFFLLLPAGRVFGRGFGFVLGALTLFASALVTGGVGPWLPFQMFAAGLAYGLVMNLWFWPFGAGADSALSYLPGAGLAENLQRFWVFHLTTSLGWDLPRAATNALLVIVFGPAVLAAFRRVARRSAFGVPVRFGDAELVDPSASVR